MRALHPITRHQTARPNESDKNAIKKMPSKDFPLHFARYLLHQHTTPHSITGRSPGELLMGRQLRKHLDAVFPNMNMHLKQEQRVNKQVVAPRVFKQDQKVFCRNYGTQGPKWTPATVTQTLGPLSYNLETDNGRLVHHHVDQMIDRRNTYE